MRLLPCTYKHAPWATVCSVSGILLMVLGIPVLFFCVLPGVFMILAGIALQYLALVISEYALYKLWLAEQLRQGKLQSPPSSLQAAWLLYKASRGK